MNQQYAKPIEPISRNFSTDAFAFDLSETEPPARHKRKMSGQSDSSIEVQPKHARVIKHAKQSKSASDLANQDMPPVHVRALSQPLASRKKLLFDGVEVLTYRAFLNRQHELEASRHPTTTRPEFGQDDCSRFHSLTVKIPINSASRLPGQSFPWPIKQYGTFFW